MIRRFQYLSLFLLSIISALVWRAEIELRWGWASLEWISAFHFSAWAICLMFSGWAYAFTPCSPPSAAFQRSIMAFVGGLFGYVLYKFCFPLLFTNFLTFWPLQVAATTVTFLLIPLSVCALAFLFSPRFLNRYWVVTPLLFAISFPASSFALWITNHPGGTDPVHAVKSGFILVAFVMAAGLPFIAGRHRP